MHVKVDTHRVVGVGVVTFGCEDEKSSKVGITVEGPNAGDDVAVEDLKRLSGDDDLPADKSRSLGRKLLVNYFVKLSRVLEREAKKRDKLND